MYEPRRDPGYLTPPDDDGIDWDTLKERWAERYGQDAYDVIVESFFEETPTQLDWSRIRNRLTSCLQTTLEEDDACLWASQVNSIKVPYFEEWATAELAGEHHIPLEDEDRP